jgi:predicted transposase YdaD
MFDKALREKFQDNPDDEAVRQQAMKLIQLVRGSQSRERTLVDIMHAAKVSGHTSKEQTAEIAFCMGLQFGFELALSYPPLPSSRPVG